MADWLGADVDLEIVPLKYSGLRYDEIWISEAQERMVLAVPQLHVNEVLKLAADEDVEATVIGTFGTFGTDDANLILNYRGTEVGRLSMEFLHGGLPMPTRSAIVSDRGTGFHPVRSRNSAEFDRENSSEHALDTRPTSHVKERLLECLAHPNIASKHWIIRQYDHEVQGGSVVKPLVGPMQIGPSDASVVRPKLNSHKGVVLACGLAPHIDDPYATAISAIDEAIRNAVCVGADPDRIAILDNFCWPSVDTDRAMGDLVLACEACRDAALAFGIPFISGKDSLNNQFTDTTTGQVIRIPNTLLISAIGVIDDVRRCVTMDLKGRTNRVVMIAARDANDLHALAQAHRTVARGIADGGVLAAHDLSDGGLFVAAAEMCIASGKGLIVGADAFMADHAFAERPGRYLLELADDTGVDRVRAMGAAHVEVFEIGLVQHLRKLTVTNHRERVLEIGIDEMTAAWRGTLDW
jgi:phosphoribosylformylglycinamidine synthase